MTQTAPNAVQAREGMPLSLVQWRSGLSDAGLYKN
jgi:hypothetical protein